MRSILKQEGIRAFYKGFGIVFFSTLPAHSLYFCGYEMSKKYLGSEKESGFNSIARNFAAGIFADICGSCLWVPMVNLLNYYSIQLFFNFLISFSSYVQDVVKQRLQVQRSNQIDASHYSGIYFNYYVLFVLIVMFISTFFYLFWLWSLFGNGWNEGPIDAVKKIVSEKGVRGLYKGYFAALATYGPFVGIYFACYEEQKKTIWKWISGKEGKEQDLKYIVCNGFISGSIAAALTCPLDVVKTRLQVDRSSTSAFKIVSDILKNEGISAFSTGMVPRILWIAPGSGIFNHFFSRYIFTLDVTERFIRFLSFWKIAITIVAYEHLYRFFSHRLSWML